MAELSKCEKHAHIVVMKNRKFRSQNQEHVIYKDLHESYTVLYASQGRTQYFVLGDQCFGHLPVIDCLPDEDVCRILSWGHCVFRSFCKTPVHQNVILSLGRKSIT